MEERETQKIFLDEYDVSEAMQAALKIGKKLEEFDLIINDLKRFNFGKDYSKCAKIIGGKELVESILPIRIRTKIYFFSVGENCYSMGLYEKRQYCDLKKPKIAALLKDGEYVKAKTMLESVKEMTERVNLANVDGQAW